jgi:hypothetical protein
MIYEVVEHTVRGDLFVHNNHAPPLLLNIPLSFAIILQFARFDSISKQY